MIRPQNMVCCKMNQPKQITYAGIIQSDNTLLYFWNTFRYSHTVIVAVLWKVYLNLKQHLIRGFHLDFNKYNY